jgi:hypothetical protein
MKNLIPLLATLLALSPSFAAEISVRIGNHDVSVITDQSADSPKTCHAALLDKVTKQGWHDEIYNSATEQKAFLVFSQRVVDNGALSKMKITFWKAIKGADGKTNVETQVFLINRTELTPFLDDEIRPLFLKFSHTQ